MPKTCFLCKRTAKHYHRFPRDTQLKEKWLLACGRSASDVISYENRLCGFHFQASDYEDKDIKLISKNSDRYKTYKRLKPGVVPTLMLSGAVGSNKGSKKAVMATSTILNTSPLESKSSSPKSCLTKPSYSTSQPKADWRASFVNMSKKITYRPSYKRPNILRQHNGPLFLQSKKTSPMKCDRKLPDSEDTNKGISTPPTPRIGGAVIRTVFCQDCLSTVEEEDLKNHLFFGPVRCIICFIVCRACSDFTLLTQEVGSLESKCQHRFEYCQDPSQYLLDNMSSDNTEFAEPSTMPSSIDILQEYMNKLHSLQRAKPWDDALTKCKKAILKIFRKDISNYLKHSRQENPYELSKQFEGQAQEQPHTFPNHLMDDSPQQVLHPIDNKLAKQTQDCGIPTNNERLDISINESERLKTIEQHTSNKLTNSEGLLLSQSYDLEHLEHEIEYIGLDICNSKLPGDDVLYKKRDIGKSRKESRLSPNKKHKKIQRSYAVQLSAAPIEEEDSDLVVEQVGLPDDGNYLMVKGSIEDCPMCYESLDPSMCTVNMRTFLFTVNCPKCNLLIYMVPDLPDGLRIVTEDTGSNVMMSKAMESKGKVSARNFLAR